MSSSDDVNEFTALVYRRPSNTFFDTPIGSFRGPNSLQNFASSFTRAQSFSASKLDSDIHRKRSFFVSESLPSGEVVSDELFDPEMMAPSPRGDRLSMVINDINSRNQIFLNTPTTDDNVLPNNDVFYHSDMSQVMNLSRKNSARGDVGGVPINNRKLLHSMSFSSVRTNLTTLTSAGHISLNKIEDKDGNVITVVEGQSTAPQTIFNSINILIGIGLLALPTGFVKAGWVIGVPFLIISGVSTFWTATLISRAMDTDGTIMTYADLGYAAYGSAAKLVISLIFSLDLLSVGVSLVVLFSDSLFALWGDNDVWTKTRFKILSYFILTPFSLLPLPILSIFSLIGIMSTISITVLVFVCGLLKPTSPGSLLSVMPPNMWPESTRDLLIAVGILLAPFGGHAVFPNLKRDMRHPQKFTGTLKITYSITLLTDLCMGLMGFLMFGHFCNNEITNNILTTSGYPIWCYSAISCLICLIPLAKTALNAKPIIATLDSIFAVNTPTENALFGSIKTMQKLIHKLSVNALFVIFAILFPEFEKIVGLSGASICFLICFILPCTFFFKLCRDKSTRFEQCLVLFTIVISIVLGGLSTYTILTD